MVKIIIITISAHFFFLCMIQEVYSDNKINLNASFSSDSVIMGDSLDLILYYKNITNDNFSLYPKAIIGLGRNHEVFITYDKAERIAYILNLFTNYDSIVSLKPGEEFKYTFNIVADSNFFYEGENEVYVYYRLFDKLPDNKKRKKYGELILSLEAPPIKITIKPRK